MSYILKNKNIELHIDHPLENYHFSRFDWTGKITNVKFRNIPLSTIENTDCQNEHYFGKGFYNEFGIETALGFEEANIGGWFHKIGVGLLKKEADQYLFSKHYEIRPAKFIISAESDSLYLQCHSEDINGYSYILKKEIELHKNGFTLKYHLLNTGEKDITTDEYVHNFTATDDEPVGDHYILKFPFQINPELFTELVNPELKVDIHPKDIKFTGTPNQPFFFSNLSGSKLVDAQWELIHRKSKIGIREKGSFKTNKVNLWGTRHVISPELFYPIFIKPGQSCEWSRHYSILQV